MYPISYVYFPGLFEKNTLMKIRDGTSSRSCTEGSSVVSKYLHKQYLLPITANRLSQVITTVTILTIDRPTLTNLQSPPVSVNQDGVSRKGGSARRLHEIHKAPGGLQR